MDCHSSHSGQGELASACICTSCRSTLSEASLHGSVVDSLIEESTLRAYRGIRSSPLSKEAQNKENIANETLKRLTAIEAPLASRSPRSHSQHEQRERHEYTSRRPRPQSWPPSVSTDVATGTSPRYFAERLHDSWRRVLRRTEVDSRRMDAATARNVEEVIQYLSRDRSVIDPEARRSFSEVNTDWFFKHLQIVEQAITRTDISSKAFRCVYRPQLLSENYVSKQHLIFLNVNDSLRNGLSPPTPDLTESYQIDGLREQTMKALGSALCPSIDNTGMPAICAEIIGPEDCMRHARTRCFYNGAVMVEAAYRVQDYLTEHQQSTEPFFNRIQALTIAYNGEYLECYGHFSVWTSAGHIEYHSTPLAMMAVTLDRALFEDAHGLVQNAFDWARTRATKTLNALQADNKLRLAGEEAQRIKNKKKTRRSLDEIKKDPVLSPRLEARLDAMINFFGPTVEDVPGHKPYCRPKDTDAKRIVQSLTPTPRSAPPWNGPTITDLRRCQSATARLARKMRPRSPSAERSRFPASTPPAGSPDVSPSPLQQRKTSMAPPPRKVWPTKTRLESAPEQVLQSVSRTRSGRISRKPVRSSPGR